MHKAALVLCVCIAVLTSAAQSQERAKQPKHKKPGDAWFLSFVYPGLGQGYNRDWARAAGFAGVASVGWGLYWNSWKACAETHTNCRQRNASRAIILAAWVGAQIDAPLRARALNRKRGLSLEVGPTPSPLGLSLARVTF